MTEVGHSIPPRVTHRAISRNSLRPMRLPHRSFKSGRLDSNQRPFDPQVVSCYTILGGWTREMPPEGFGAVRGVGPGEGD